MTTLVTANTHPAPRVGVACSGGPDSLALLHATVAQARALGLEVWALHVHHGLLPQADAWVQALARRCRRWRAAGAPLHFAWMRLAGSPPPGESVEAWARQGRYRALAEMAQQHGVGLVLLAHHRRDQAETVLLQALRGGGAAGLAAMPRDIEREGLRWVRPWLDSPPQAIHSYSSGHGLRGVEDPSNLDSRYARSRLRQAVWPALAAAFEDAEVALGRAAQRAAIEQAALDEWGQADLAQVTQARALLRSAWLNLSAPRRDLVLRRWLRALGAKHGVDVLVQRLCAELPLRRLGRWQVRERGELVLYRDVLRLRSAPIDVTPGPSLMMDLSRPGRHVAPGWGGSWLVQPSPGPALPAQLLAQTQLCQRQGAEQFQGVAGRPPRSLKKQFQAASVSAQDRRGPLLYARGKLVFVPGLGVDVRCLQPMPGLSLQWQPATGP